MSHDAVRPCKECLGIASTRSDAVLICGARMAEQRMSAENERLRKHGVVKVVATEDVLAQMAALKKDMAQLEYCSLTRIEALLAAEKKIKSLEEKIEWFRGRLNKYEPPESWVDPTKKGEQ